MINSDRYGSSLSSIGFVAFKTWCFFLPGASSNLWKVVCIFMMIDLNYLRSSSLFVYLGGYISLTVSSLSAEASTSSKVDSSCWISKSHGASFPTIGKGLTYNYFLFLTTLVGFISLEGLCGGECSIGRRGGLEMTTFLFRSTRVEFCIGNKGDSGELGSFVLGLSHFTGISSSLRAIWTESCPTRVLTKALASSQAVCLSQPLGFVPIV